MKTVAIVTVNYDTEADTHALLASLKKIKPADFTFTTIIIDNGSKVPFLLEKHEEATVIRLETNTGFTGGYNTGMKKALADGSEYILIINNDTLVAPDMLIQLLAPFEHDKKIGVTVPKIYFAKGNEFHKDRYKKEDLGNVLWYAGGFMDWENVTSVHRGVDEVDHGQYEKQEKITFATGCCMLFKRKVLEGVSLFDERYFLYYEDADLNKRILDAGHTVVYVPQANLWHVNASSSGSGSALHDYFLTRNQMLFGMKYAPLRSKIALIRQSIRLLTSGRKYQKQGIRDFYLGRFGKGTFFKK